MKVQDIYNDDNMTSKWMIHRVLQKAYDATLKDLKAIDDRWSGHYGDLSCTEYEFNRGEIQSIVFLAQMLGIELNIKENK
tara:strand:+ start:506 stop:745 length:240 start_codon:yes stop_codon:yes gene_type:complete